MSSRNIVTLRREIERERERKREGGRGRKEREGEKREINIKKLPN